MKKYRKCPALKVIIAEGIDDPEEIESGGLLRSCHYSHEWCLSFSNFSPSVMLMNLCCSKLQRHVKNYTAVIHNIYCELSAKVDSYDV